MSICYEEAVIMALINKKLDELGYTGTGYFKESDKEKFFYSCDEKGNGYLILNSNLALDVLAMTEVMLYPLDYHKALHSEEVLKTINLIEVNGEIISRNKYYKKLTEKYELKPELSLERNKFNIFKEWEKVPEDGFIENYCLSDEEKMILQELRKTKTLKENPDMSREELILKSVLNIEKQDDSKLVKTRKSKNTL